MSQADAILAHLQAGHSLTPLEALGQFNCFRLADVVWKLKRRGWPVETTIIGTASGKRIAEYSLRRETT